MDNYHNRGQRQFRDHGKWGSMRNRPQSKECQEPPFEPRENNFHRNNRGRNPYKPMQRKNSFTSPDLMPPRHVTETPYPEPMRMSPNLSSSQMSRYHRERGERLFQPTQHYSQRQNNRGLGSDIIRQQLIGRIKSTASVICSQNRKVEPMTLAPLAAPIIPTTPAGRSLVLFDSVCTLKHYASTICRCFLDQEAGSRLIHGHPSMATGSLSWMYPMLSRCMGEPIMGYEVEIKRFLSLFFGPDADSEFINWKSKGMCYPMLIASYVMHTPEDWLPVEFHSCVPAFGSILCEINSANTKEALDAAMKRLETEVDYSTPGGISIAATLDHICSLMGVLSNSSDESCDLTLAARAFPYWTTASTRDIWLTAKKYIEKFTPPSLLCPALSVHSRPTWGYPKMTLVYSPSTGLRILENKLTWLECCDITRIPRKLICTEEYSAIGAAKLRSFLLRMGELVTTPELAYAMLHGTEQLEDFTKPAKVLEILSQDNPTCSHPEAVSAFLSNVLEGMPQPTWSPDPVRIAGWKITPPSVVTLYNVQSPKENLARPHTLERAVTNQRCNVLPMSRIMYIPHHMTNEDFLDLVRTDVLVNLKHHISTGVKTPVGMDQHTHTPLFECMFALGSEPPLLHTEAKMGTNLRWVSEHVDARYAETQLGSNGFKYRDTVVFSKEKANQAKGSLVTHIAEYADGHYISYFPWRSTDGMMHWTKVASSLKPTLMVIHQSGESKTPLEALVQGITKRYIKNTRLFPVRDPSHVVHEAGTSIYFDNRTNSVLVTYAPIGGENPPRVEFMCFQMIPDP